MSGPQAEENDQLPRVILQDEMTIGGRVVSVTGYEEEERSGGAGGGATHLLFSLMNTEGLGGSGQWKVLVTDADLKLADGAFKSMSRKEKGQVGQRVARALRWGGEGESLYAYLDRTALEP